MLITAARLIKDIVFENDLMTIFPSSSFECKSLPTLMRVYVDSTFAICSDEISLNLNNGTSMIKSFVCLQFEFTKLSHTLELSVNFSNDECFQGRKNGTLRISLLGLVFLSCYIITWIWICLFKRFDNFWFAKQGLCLRRIRLFKKLVFIVINFRILQRVQSFIWSLICLRVW